jgi:hypothetical protein
MLKEEQVFQKEKTFKKQLKWFENCFFLQISFNIFNIFQKMKTFITMSQDVASWLNGAE